MIPNTSSNFVETNSDSSSQFTVANSSYLIELLSTRLYGDKLGSFIREICTNAIDANISAGNPDEPITIGIENADGIVVVAIGDSGLGMSPELIQSKLAVLGESTKDGDNESHGGFGIGFLTVVSVSLNIEIHSFHSGIFYHYRICDNRGQLGIYLVESKFAVGEGTIVKVWLDRDYVRHKDVDRAGSDLRRAVGNFAYPLKVSPKISSGDWQLFSSEQLTRSIASFHQRRLCGDADYAFHLQSDKAIGNSRKLNIQRWSMVSQNIVIMLGEVGYSVSTNSLLEGMDDWNVRTIDEDQLRDFCRGCGSGSGLTDSNNCLILYFNIGDLAVSTSRERLVESVANSRRIFDKLLLAYDRLKLFIPTKMIHSPRHLGVLGVAPSDYFAAAASWGLYTVKFGEIDIDPFNHHDLTHCHSRWQKQDNNRYDRHLDEIVYLTSKFTKSSFTAAQLLQSLIEISRTGSPKVIVVDGESKDISILRLLKKFPEGNDLDLDRTIVIDIRSECTTFEILVNQSLPWLTKFASVSKLETIAGKASLTFNKSSVSTLIWLNATDPTAPVHTKFYYTGRTEDSREFSRSNLSSFTHRHDDRSLPIYYFGPTDFNYRLFRVFKTTLDLLQIELPDLYIIGSKAADSLRDKDYQLTYAWDLVLPALNDWVGSSWLVTSGRLGFTPTHHYSSHPDSTISDIIDARLSFLTQPAVINFIDPAKIWLIEWLSQNAKLADFVTMGLLDAIVASKEWDYASNSLACECKGKILSTRQIGSRDDKCLAQSIDYLFADMLSSLPILTRSIGLFNANHFDLCAERATADLCLQEIESGSLKRWREQNPH